MKSSLFSCRVHHRRYAPRAYGFTTRLFMWQLDLDELDSLCERLPLLSHNSPNVYSFRDEDHLYLGKGTLRENVEAYLEQEGITERPKRITLLTNLRTFGYVFNPVSFFYCYDENDQPMAVVVEVHNTYGELKPFLLRKEDLQEQKFSRMYPKMFYISPFSHLDHQLEIIVAMPGDRIRMSVNNYETGARKPFFRSSLTGQRGALSTASMLGYTFRFPFVTLKIITLIHWHALKLYLKKVPFYPKSKDPHLQTGILPKKHQTAPVSSP